MVLLSPQQLLCRRACMNIKKTKIKKKMLETYKMLSTEIPWIRNYIHITVISYFHLELMSKPVSLKIVGLKLVKLDCIIL